MLPAPQIVLEDNHLLVCLKPAGMPVQSDDSGDESLVDWAKAYVAATYNKAGEAFVGLVHRIDRPVSGLVLLTKTSKALTRLNQAVASRSIVKRYLAQVEHKPDAPMATLVDHLMKHAETNTSRRVSPKHPHGKRAELTYKVVEIQGQQALLAIDLQTGRHHQIRVQLSARGWPIVGDVKYGARAIATPQAIHLHAAYLAFTHPVSQAAIVLEKAPLWAPEVGTLAHFYEGV
jgi:23S rRNA pseudouridine1911/1915/1917 synthase